MADEGTLTDEEESPGRKKGKKKYYPFGTPTHASQPFSQFSHIKNPQTQAFAATLASTGAFETDEEIVEKPRRTAKRTGTASKSAASVAAAVGSATAENPANAIPDAEGLEPCTKIPCQQVLRALSDIQVKNELERQEIEDQYEQLLQELAIAEQEIQTAETKLQRLNEIGGQLEQRHDQLYEKVDALERAKESQNSERNDVNSKIMICQTDKNKRTRILDKAIKALSDAMWRKKKREQSDNAEAGLTLAVSEIAERPIIHTDAASVASLGSIYKTPYNLLSTDRTRDAMELPPTIKILPPYMKDVLEGKDGQTRHHYAQMDKHAKHHYATLQEHGIKSWAGMDGSLMTASIYSSATHGHGPESLAKSYEEYTILRQNRGQTGPSAAATRVGEMLKSRSGMVSLSGGPGSLSGKISAMDLASSSAGGSGLGSSASVNNVSLLSSSVNMSGGSINQGLGVTIKSRGNISPNGFRTGAPDNWGLPKGDDFAYLRDCHSVRGGPRVAAQDKKSLSQSLMASRKSGSGNVRLAPIGSMRAKEAQSASLRGGGGSVSFEIGERGLENEGDEEGMGPPKYAAGSASGRVGSISNVSQLSQDSHLREESMSPQSMSILSNANNTMGGDSLATGGTARRLDPVFVKNNSRGQWGRGHKVGEVRRGEVAFGMPGYKDPRKSVITSDDEDSSDDEAVAPTLSGLGGGRRGGSVRGAGSSANSLSISQRRLQFSDSAQSSSRFSSFKDQQAQLARGERTVKSRTLTVYHPGMPTFEDASILPKRKGAHSAD